MVGHILPPAHPGVLRRHSQDLHELLVNLAVVLLDQVGNLVFISLEERLHQPQLGPLRFQHLRRDAVRRQDRLDQPLHTEHRARLEHVPAPFLRRGAVHHRFDQLADHPLLLLVLQAKLHRDIDQKQFFGRIMIQQRSEQPDPVATVRACGGAGLPGQEARLGRRIAAYINDLFDLGRVGLAAVGAGDDVPSARVSEGHPVLPSLLLYGYTWRRGMVK